MVYNKFYAILHNEKGQAEFRVQLEHGSHPPLMIEIDGRVFEHPYAEMPEDFKYKYTEVNSEYWVPPTDKIERL